MSGRTSKLLCDQTCFGKIFYWTTLLIFLYCIFLGVIYMPSHSSVDSSVNRVHFIPQYQVSLSENKDVEGSQDITLEENVLGDQYLSGRGTKFNRKILSEKNLPGKRSHSAAASTKTVEKRRKNTQINQPVIQDDSEVIAANTLSGKSREKNTQKTLPGLRQHDSPNSKAILTAVSGNAFDENRQKPVKYLPGVKEKNVRPTPASNVLSGSGYRKVTPKKKYGMARNKNVLTVASKMKNVVGEYDKQVAKKDIAATRPDLKSLDADDHKSLFKRFPLKSRNNSRSTTVPRRTKKLASHPIPLLQDITYKTLMKTPRPKFLKDYRAPCLRMSGPKTGSEQSANESYIACLPAVYLAGQPKCGSTDLYQTLTLHPQVFRTFKEPQYWSRHRFSKREERMEAYLDMYKAASERIQSNCVKIDSDHQCMHKNIFIDGSVSLFWDNAKWPLMPGNAQQGAPRVLNAHHIRHLTPNAKFIVILRDPVRRQYSSYAYFKFGRTVTSAQDFHEKVVQAVKLFEDCAEEFGVRSCAYNATLRRASPLRLHPSLYSIYVSDWLKVFPRDQFYFLRLEDYKQSRSKYVLEIIDFLGLDEAPSWSLKLDQRKVVNQQTRKPKLDMFPETKKILEDFFAPFNRKLARILNNPDYLYH